MSATTMNRRQFLATLGGCGLVFAFRHVPLAAGPKTATGTAPAAVFPPEDQPVRCLQHYPDVDYTGWVVIGPDQRVRVFTGRTELGQGLRTVVTAVVCQGLDIKQAQLTVVLGDTDLCPDDGITNGSSGTRQVAMGFWAACQKIRTHMLGRASARMNVPVEKLEYRSLGVGAKGEPGSFMGAYELGGNRTVTLDIDPGQITLKEYIDLEIPNVNGEQIVTGQLKYAGDLSIPGQLYAGWQGPPYHKNLSQIESADLDGARSQTGIKRVDKIWGRIAVVGERYSDVVRALDRVKTQWRPPDAPQQLPTDEETRREAVLEQVNEEQGDVEGALASSDLVLSESYRTQFTSHVQMETDTAVATPPDDEGRVTVWNGGQGPFYARETICRYLGLPESKVRIITVPSGGAFGGKIGNPVNRESAMLAGLVNAPVKLIYSRDNQFRYQSYYKASCLMDITTGVGSDGLIRACKFDIYQDLAEGITGTYAIPNLRIRTLQAPVPFGRASSRGTSFVQTMFAVESHMDMVAHRLGLDPLEFRRRNAGYPAYLPLLDACAEMIGYDQPRNTDEGIGLAMIRHGGAQLGATAARVAVNRDSGKITVLHICSALDVGPIMNRNTARTDIRGGITWGIGYALGEELDMDRHVCRTRFLSQYRLPRFSDIPPIDIQFFDNHHPGSIRGCGEMSLVPTIGAIVNAVYDAVGVRFYRTPLTPERVKGALP